MTQPTTDEAPRGVIAKIRLWAASPARVTNGYLLLCTVVAFIFFGCAAWATVEIVQLDNRVTRDQVVAAVEDARRDCIQDNTRRAEARIVALADVEADRALWVAVDDVLEEGLPADIATLIFDGLAEREARIDATYRDEVCP